MRQGTNWDALTFLDTFQAFKRNGRQNLSISIVMVAFLQLQEGKAPGSLWCTAHSRDHPPRMAAEIRKQHMLWSRTWSLLAKSRLSKYSQPQTIFWWQRWVENSRLYFCLELNKKYSSRGDREGKDLLKSVSQIKEIQVIKVEAF